MLPKHWSSFLLSHLSLLPSSLAGGSGGCFSCPISFWVFFGVLGVSQPYHIRSHETIHSHLLQSLHELNSSFLQTNTFKLLLFTLSGIFCFAKEDFRTHVNGLPAWAGYLFFSCNAPHSKVRPVKNTIPQEICLKNKPVHLHLGLLRNR